VTRRVLAWAAIVAVDVVLLVQTAALYRSR
jgi:hypothetical protein